MDETVDGDKFFIKQRGRMKASCVFMQLYGLDSNRQSIRDESSIGCSPSNSGNSRGALVEMSKIPWKDPRIEML